ncbi:molybdenum cofactor guanylyltransferase [Neorhodopirellula pilleata]|uniref:Probable molybdenum cofactor guanylyltransferase n=1 Tax=Neorhodopirellula pilleata TaxID=2714738 RepID=A0A5C6AQM9_9BACT|nr:molybdenum cofactor guanylyltransferase [Neorhodopirellula pilleata]TWU02030.1 molybdopterin-guanine dinucleotide biosynthesis protein MobA [Neorhodopirellula pilleata]
MSTSGVSRILGVVLAGGRSSRMGHCKAELAHPRGGTFLRHAISELLRCCDKVSVSLNADQAGMIDELIDTEHHSIVTLIDQIDQRGPAEGLRLAIEYAVANSCTGVLVIPVDLPFLPAHELQVLADTFGDQPDQIVTAVSEETPTRIEPLVAIYPVALQKPIECLVSSDDRSLYRFIERYPHQTVRLSAHALTNVNHPTQWPLIHTDE